MKWKTLAFGFYLRKLGTLEGLSEKGRELLRDMERVVRVSDS